MKKILLLTTALAVTGHQAAASDFQIVQDPQVGETPGFGVIAVGALVAGAAVAIAGAAGGGGSGGGGGGGGSDPVEPFDDSPRRGETAPREGFNTAEYRRNWGLDSLRADYRYADGGTGLGVLSATFDSGIAANHSDLDDQVVYRYSYFSLDNDVTDYLGHGTHVGGIIAAEKNDVGTHGVAFDSKLAVFKAFSSGETLAVDFFDAWADATYKASDLGAQVINHSWNLVDDNDQTLTVDTITSANQALWYFGSDVINSMRYAAEHDMISVFAAGNSGLSDAGNQAALGLYFPELSDYVLTVVAIDQNDKIASFSNRCGDAADLCLAAPGVDILSTVPGGYGTQSGTSMAAPHVTGAIGLLASNFPELTGSEITTILKETARDLGAVGVDEVYGHGALDLQNAMAPQGSIAFQAGARLGEDTYSVRSSHISGSGGVGKALASAFSGQKIIVTDRYDRAYATGMDEFVGSGEDIQRDLTSLNLFTSGEGRALRASSSANSLSFSTDGIAALGGDGTVNPTVVAPYAGLLENASSMSYGSDLGGAWLSISGATEALESDGNNNYVSIEARAPIGPHGLTIGFGQLNEHAAFLGTDVSGAFGDDLKTKTDFVSLKGDFAVSSDSSIFLSGAIGQSKIDGDGMIRGGDLTTQNLGLGFDASNAFLRGDRLQVSLNRSMAVTGGHIDVRVPTALAAAENGVRSDKVELSSASLDMSDASAPIDLTLGYEFDLHGGRLAIGGALRHGDTRHRIASIGYNFHF